MQQRGITFPLQNGNKHSTEGKVIKLSTAANHVLYGEAFHYSYDLWMGNDGLGDFFSFKKSLRVVLENFI